MRGYRRVWTALSIIVIALLLVPLIAVCVPSDAERELVKLHVGMPLNEAKDLLVGVSKSNNNLRFFLHIDLDNLNADVVWQYPDRSEVRAYVSNEERIIYFDANHKLVARLSRLWRWMID